MVDFSTILNGRGVSSAPFVFGSATTISKQITASGNDIEESKANGSIGRTSTDLELLFEGVVFQVVGLRFLAVGIPQGRTIQSAYIQFVADVASPNNTPTIVIAAEANDSAASVPLTAFSLSSRPRTTATVAWSPPQWVNAGDAGTAQRTPDLSAPLQEVVNRPGFTASSNVQFIFYDDTNNSATRSAVSFDSNAANAPTLVVTYL
jgi:hypothetical protein